MDRYELGYDFSHVGTCLWSLNTLAKKKYGYFIDTDELPLFEQTKQKIRMMQQEFDTRVNWERGGKHWSWLDEWKFNRKAKAFCKVISAELGSDYVVKSDRQSIVNGIRSAFWERGVKHTDIFEHYFTARAEVAPYYDNANHEDFVYGRHHYRAAVGKTGGVVEFMPLDKYTPNFHPEKLKALAMSAEPYDLSAPEIKMFDSKDPEIQARRQATFARITLKEHYGTDDMSKWV